MKDRSHPASPNQFATNGHSIESFPNRSKLIAMTNKLAGNEMLVRDGFKGWERRG